MSITEDYEEIRRRIGPRKYKGIDGVRIDIWTHFMRECIINYVH